MVQSNAVENTKSGRSPNSGSLGGKRGYGFASMWKRHALQLFKTDVCKFFLQGRCLNGEKCSYAHNLDEMRRKPDLTRTSLCRNLAQTGVCEDPSCRFAHEDHDLRATHGFFKMKMCGFAQSGRCKHGKNCRFAHTIEELRPLEPAAIGAEDIHLPAAVTENQQDVPAPPTQPSEHQQQRQQQRRRNQQNQQLGDGKASSSESTASYPKPGVAQWEQFPGSRAGEDQLRQRQGPDGKTVKEVVSSGDGSGGSDTVAGTATTRYNGSNPSSGEIGAVVKERASNSWNESDSAQSADGSDNAQRSSRSPGSSSWAWADPADSNATDQSGDMPLSEHAGSRQTTSVSSSNNHGNNHDALNGGSGAGGSSSGSGSGGEGQQTATQSPGHHSPHGLEQHAHKVEQRARRQEAMQGRRQRQLESEAAAASPDKVTTLLVTNIAPYFTQRALLSMFEDLTYAMRGNFDFFYCPWDEKNGHNLGTATINFPEVDHATAFQQIWHSKELCRGGRGQKALKVVKAQLQGLQANVEYFSMLESAQCTDARFRPLYRDGAGLLTPLPLSAAPDMSLVRTAAKNDNVQPQAMAPMQALPATQPSLAQQRPGIDYFGTGSNRSRNTQSQDASDVQDGVWPRRDDGFDSTGSSYHQETFVGHQQSRATPPPTQSAARTRRVGRARERPDRNFPNVMRREEPTNKSFNSLQTQPDPAMGWCSMTTMMQWMSMEGQANASMRRNAPLRGYQANTNPQGPLPCYDNGMQQVQAELPLQRITPHGDTSDFQLGQDYPRTPFQRPFVNGGDVPGIYDNINMGQQSAQVPFREYMPSMMMPSEADAYLHGHLGADPSAFHQGVHPGQMLHDGLFARQNSPCEPLQPIQPLQSMPLGGWVSGNDDGVYTD